MLENTNNHHSDPGGGRTHNPIRSLKLDLAFLVDREDILPRRANNFLVDREVVIKKSREENSRGSWIRLASK